MPRGDVNVPSDYFSLAGFEVIMDGRFWVRTEVSPVEKRDSYTRNPDLVWHRAEATV